MCDRIISDHFFSLRYVPNQYKTQQMCDKAVDDYSAALKFVPDWFVTSKIFEILVTDLYPDENIIYFNEDFNNIVFTCNIAVNNINFGDTNYDEDNHDTINLVRLFAWHIKFGKC